jgi:hypothetical protein
MLDRVAVAPTVSMTPIERVPDLDEQRKYFADDDDPLEQAAWDQAMEQTK